MTHLSDSGPRLKAWQILVYVAERCETDMDTA